MRTSLSLLIIMGALLSSDIACLETTRNLQGSSSLMLELDGSTVEIGKSLLVNIQLVSTCSWDAINALINMIMMIGEVTSITEYVLTVITDSICLGTQLSLILIINIVSQTTTSSVPVSWIAQLLIPLTSMTLVRANARIVETTVQNVTTKEAAWSVLLITAIH